MKYLTQIFWILVLAGSILKLNNIEASSLISRIGLFGVIITQSIQIIKLNKRIKRFEERQ